MMTDINSKRTCKAAVVSVGDELLRGEFANSNASDISRKLRLSGIPTVVSLTVGDNINEIKSILQIAQEKADLVIITGGLGPTVDDITREALAEFTGKQLGLNQTAFNELNAWYKKRNRVPSGNNLKQASMPEGAEPIENPIGSAPGIWLEYSKSIFVALPGVPYEMNKMLDKYIIPKITDDKSKPKYKIVKIFAMAESEVDAEVYKLNLKGVDIGIFVSYGEISVYLELVPGQKEELLNEAFNKVKLIFGENVFSESEDRLETSFVKLCLEKKIKFAVAESLTGGMIGHLLTQVPGVSESFTMGAITYSNESKSKMLGVNEETLKAYGAVSDQVAKEMAQGVLLAGNVDLGMGITGIAGPGGGSTEKPVGLVYIGVATKKRCEVKRINLSGPRAYIKERAARTAIDCMRRMALKI